MATELITIKTTAKARRILKVVAAQHDVTQGVAMEVLLTIALENFNGLLIAAAFDMEKTKRAKNPAA